MPPRATSMTAKSTRGFCSTIRAERGPDASAFTTRRSSMTMPSVEVMPTWRPTPFMMCAIIRDVVVLPFVPVTATIGTRERRTGREEQVDDRLGDVLRLADRSGGCASGTRARR